jgi:hypothetical protein
MYCIALQTSDAVRACYTLYMRQNLLARDNALHFENGLQKPISFCLTMLSARHIQPAYPASRGHNECDCTKHIAGED